MTVSTRLARLLLLPIGLLSIAAAPPPSAFGAAAVAEEELADMRGGFTLPSGVNVAIAVQTDTLVNGNLLLRSAFVIDQGTPQLSVFVPKDGEQVPGTPAGTTSSSAGPIISYDRQGGLQVIPRGQNAPAVTVTSGQAPRTLDPNAPGLQKLELDRGGSVQTPNGLVSLDQVNGVERVRLQNDRLQTNHLFGGALGSLTTNTGNDVSLDTVTTISIELGNVSADTVGSSLFRVEGIALESTRALTRGGF